MEVMKRPGVGEKGQKVPLVCNHFQCKFSVTGEIAQYDVTIVYENDNAPVDRKPVSRRVIEYLRKHGKLGTSFIFDGDKNLYSLGRLKISETELKVALDDDQPTPNADDPSKKRRTGWGVKQFKVRLAFATLVDMKSLEGLQRGQYSPRVQDALRVLDILLKEQAVRRSYVLMRDSYFHESLGAVNTLGGGAVVWRGYHATFRPSSGGFSLNLDPSTTVMISPQLVHEFAREYLGKQFNHFVQEDMTKLKRILRGVEVQGYSGAKHKLTGFSDNSAAKETFEWKKGRARDPNAETEIITVQNYYKKRHGVELDFPNLPCVNVGRSKRPNYIPMNLCKILPGQRYRRKLTGNQVRSHLDAARQDPGQRKRVIQQGMDALQQASADLLKSFNVIIDKTPVRVQGRVLPAPSLRFGRGDETFRDARWNYNRQTFIRPSQITNWAVVSFARYPEQEARSIAMQLKQCCEKKGMVVNEPAHVFVEEPRSQGKPPLERVTVMLNRMKSRIGNQPPSFILCILPAKECDLYAPFKRIFLTQVGIVNQCIVPPRVIKDQYLSNVALKINAKTGGYNSLLSKESQRSIPKLSERPTMVVGMDVSHGQFRSSSSVAALVASKDWPHFTQYAGRVGTQSRGQESIANIGSMFGELLKVFVSRQGAVPPEQILIFRDGVSESQFESVLTVELESVVEACEKFKAGYRPKFTLVVAQKRHHTRFFPEERADQNIAPGTVIDTGICHPRNFDFFLSSHNAIRGSTVRPTHYVVLYDEIGFTADELQDIVNNLCYNYVKSTTAVSVVSPVYYAHLAASKARNFINDDVSESGSSSSATVAAAAAGPSTLAPARPVPPVPPLQARVANTMFFV